MCLVIAVVFSFLSISFYQSSDFLNSGINGTIALVFFVLMIRNIIKTKKERKDKK